MIEVYNRITPPFLSLSSFHFASKINQHCFDSPLRLDAPQSRIADHIEIPRNNAKTNINPKTSDDDGDGDYDASDDDNEYEVDHRTKKRKKSNNDPVNIAASKRRQNRKFVRMQQHQNKRQTLTHSTHSTHD